MPGTCCLMAPSLHQRPVKYTSVERNIYRDIAVRISTWMLCQSVLSGKLLPRRNATIRSCIANPIYILRLGNADGIVFPEERMDLGHCDFWEQCVSLIVAKHYHIPIRKLMDLPYCQRRARICSDIILYREACGRALLAKIRKAVEQAELVFAYHEHEKRLAMKYVFLGRSRINSDDLVTRPAKVTPLPPFHHYPTSEQDHARACCLWGNLRSLGIFGLCLAGGATFANSDRDCNLNDNCICHGRWLRISPCLIYYRRLCRSNGWQLSWHGLQ
jgi:hypothetical protein